MFFQSCWAFCVKTQSTAHGDRGRDCSDASTNQETPKIASLHKSWKTCNGFSLRVLRKNEFCWDLKSQTPAFRTVIKLISVHLSHQFVVLCYGSFGKLTQVVSTAVSESLMGLVWIILWTHEFSLAGIKLGPSSTYPTCSLKYAPIILKVICKFKFSLCVFPFSFL